MCADRLFLEVLYKRAGVIYKKLCLVNFTAISTLHQYFGFMLLRSLH